MTIYRSGFIERFKSVLNGSRDLTPYFSLHLFIFSFYYFLSAYHNIIIIDCDLNVIIERKITSTFSDWKAASVTMTLVVRTAAAEKAEGVNG